MQYSEVIVTVCLIGFLCNPLEASPFKRDELQGNLFERDGRERDPMMGRGPGFTRDYGRQGGCFPHIRDSGKGSNSMTGAKVSPANFGVPSGSLDTGSSSSAASTRMVRDVQHPRKFTIGNPGKMGSQANKPKRSNDMTGAKVYPAKSGVTKNNADARSGKVGTAPGQIMNGTTGGSGKPSGSLDIGSSSSAASTRVVRDAHIPLKFLFGNPDKMGSEVNKPNGSNSMTGTTVNPFNLGVTKSNADIISGKVETTPGQMMYGTTSRSFDTGSSSSAASTRVVRDVQHLRKFPNGNPDKMGSQVNNPKGNNSMIGTKVKPAKFGVTKNNADAMSGKVVTAPGQIMYGTKGGSGKPSGSFDAGSNSRSAGTRMIRDVQCHKKFPIGNPGELGPQVNNNPGGIAF